ncbi:hypothetical protein CKF54_05910 [Psittacicella hinzii]|uniref:Uncharacterized protein n=1 Tax=Psittacicella hinzii TaxID=2028575 RepID=A0A3A1Y3P9_9GAMM|nr:hypothetical protein [Psittacicella hinzii]RIY31876.1 hypothetical protein CKF54_05910 [Psittacicella hinzii]
MELKLKIDFDQLQLDADELQQFKQKLESLEIKEFETYETFEEELDEFLFHCREDIEFSPDPDDDSFEITSWEGKSYFIKVLNNLRQELIANLETSTQEAVKFGKQHRLNHSQLLQKYKEQLDKTYQLKEEVFNDLAKQNYKLAIRPEIVQDYHSQLNTYLNSLQDFPQSTFYFLTELVNAIPLDTIRKESSFLSDDHYTLNLLLAAVCDHHNVPLSVKKTTFQKTFLQHLGEKIAITLSDQAEKSWRESLNKIAKACNLLKKTIKQYNASLNGIYDNTFATGGDVIFKIEALAYLSNFMDRIKQQGLFDNQTLKQIAQEQNLDMY